MVVVKKRGIPKEDDPDWGGEKNTTFHLCGG